MTGNETCQSFRSGFKVRSFFLFFSKSNLIYSHGVDWDESHRTLRVKWSSRVQVVFRVVLQRVRLRTNNAWPGSLGDEAQLPRPMPGQFIRRAQAVQCARGTATGLHRRLLRLNHF